MGKAWSYGRNSLDGLYPPERRRQTAAAGLLLGVLAVIYFLLPPRPAIGPDEDGQSATGVPSAAALGQEEAAESLAKTVELTLRRGDTLLGLLIRHGLQGPPANELISRLKPFDDPKRMRPGDSFRLIYADDGVTVQALERSLRGSLVRVLSTENGWVAERVEIPYVRDTRVIRGSIRASLFEDGVGAGLTPLHIHNLASLLEHDIDFFSDIRPGDDFSVMLEEKQYADGQRANGTMLAAEIQARGAPYRIFYYKGGTEKGSYYDIEGRALMKAFLRAPLSYTRISSHYNPARRHPIFRTVRPHLAIDYAAPTGTPVVAVGHGRVTFVGSRAGYGNLVEIRHNNDYVSRYAHFSKFAKGIRPGDQVRQGQVVGYVGQTGHATGPHLHFEMLKQGRKINFLDLKTAPTERLKGAELREFLAMRDKKLPLLQGQAPAAGGDRTSDS